MGAVAVGAILFAVLLVIAAAMVLQEARSSSENPQPVYLLDEATRFVFDRLAGGPLSRLDIDDVRTILEWGLYHSQVVSPRRDEGPPVVGGAEAFEYVVGRAAAGDGEPYHHDDVAAVLALETEYLVEIGAIGDPVEDDLP
jgi:hypothetical protein